MTLNIQKTEVTSGIFGVRGWDEPSAQQGLTSVQSTKVYKYVQSIYKAYKLYTIHVLNMTQLQMFQKVESGGGPILKVVLEC